MMRSGGVALAGVLRQRKRARIMHLNQEAVLFTVVSAIVRYTLLRESLEYLMHFLYISHSTYKNKKLLYDFYNNFYIVNIYIYIYKRNLILK
jgi:hypothetical protein